MRNAYSSSVLEALEETLVPRVPGMKRERNLRTELLDAVYSFWSGVIGVQVCETWDELRSRWRTLNMSWAHSCALVGLPAAGAMTHTSCSL